MSTRPAYASTPRCSIGQLAIANANRDGTGTVVTIFTAGVSGSRIEHIDIMGQGTVTGGMVRLYIYDGATYRLWKELAVTATTPSGTVPGFFLQVDCSTPGSVLILPAGYSLRGSTANGEIFNVHCFGGDF